MKKKYVPFSMKVGLWLSAAAILASASNPFSPLAVAPSNDLFVNAIDINLAGGLPYTSTGINTVDATPNIDPSHNVPGDPQDVNLVGCGISGDRKAGNHSVWYKYTTSKSGTITVNTRGSEALFDTMLGVFQDVSGTATLIRCDDDSAGNLKSLVTFNAVKDQVYYFAASSYSGPLTTCVVDATHTCVFDPGGNLVFQVMEGAGGGGGDSTGVFRPSNGLLYLKNTNTSGFADVAINYGIASDYPVAGDWDGNGTATIGIYRNGTFYLRNSNSIGFADLAFAFGSPGDQPVAGDWNGDGIDTIGVYRNGLFLLRNSNSAGGVDTSFALGNPGDVGIAGDWNGDGLDTTGVFRPSNGVIFLKNFNTSGFADIALNYGLSGDQPVIGDWDNDGIDTIGVYRNANFYLRNSNTNGFADLVFALGNPGDMPIAGNWDGIP